MFTKFIFLLNEFKKLKHEIKWGIQYNGYWLINFFSLSKFTNYLYVMRICKIGEYNYN